MFFEYSEKFAFAEQSCNFDCDDENVDFEERSEFESSRKKGPFMHSIKAMA